MNVTVNSEKAAESKRAQLAQRLRAMAVQDEGLPLSFSQQRLWFLDQLQPNSPLYNVSSVARATGPLDIRLLEEAIGTIIKRHEALRTRFQDKEGSPVQIIEEDATIHVTLHDLSEVKVADREPRTRDIIRAVTNKPFNLSAGKLLRADLIRHGQQDHVLVIVMHHIVSDEWSLKVFFKELSVAYSDLVKGNSPALSSLPIQYSDFAAWQRKWMRGEILEKQLSFWKQQLGGDLPLTELPTDHPRNLVPEFNGRSLVRRLAPETVDALKTLAEVEKATPFMVLLASLSALVSRYSGQHEITIGSPVAGRNRLETEGLIGFFVNTLPLRTSLSGDPSFKEIVQRVRQMTLEAFAHQDLPLDKIVEELRPERSLNHMPFTRLIFTLQAGVMEDLQLDGAMLRFEDVDSQTAKFDLTLVAQETSKGMVLKAEYDTALFDPGSIERLLQNFEILLAAGANAPGTRLSALPVMADRELSLVSHEWSGGGASSPPSRCIHQFFEAQAENKPAAVAVVFGKSRLTYGELNSRANQVAHFLRQLGVGPDVPVAICTHRSIELIVGILGILKAGGAYVPLDPAYPKERLEFMLSDTKAPVLLTEQGLLAELPQCPAKVVCLDSDWDLLARESRQNPANSSTPESLAYIMYTSGSTGSPKGVCATHVAVCRLVLNTNYIQLNASDRVAQVSNASFDAATFEIWGALLNGARLVHIGKDLALSPPEFAEELRHRKISALFLTTALFNQLAHDAPAALATVKTVMFGGEAADPKCVRAIISAGKPQRLLNVYGPTENTTFSTWHLIDTLAPDAATIPIGIPISYTEAFVVDRSFKPVPIGVPGELCLSGPGLARGYWKRPDLTAANFVTAAIGNREPRLFYKTGDLVKWLPSGAIEFVGRIDNQVKIRGFRVEPGEIETLLTQHSGVREAAVVLHGKNSSDRRLVAYTVAAHGCQINASELRSFLKEKLPEYMVPAAFVTLDALPLTPNGKVDRKALPAPDRARPELEGGYIAPREQVEQKLATIWEEVLNVRPIGIHDKFFDLGGHSLLAVRLVAKIEKVFGRKLRLATIFQAPTIAQLAAVLREDVRESNLISKTSIVEIQAQGTRPPLFLVHGAGGGMFWGYVNLSRHLGSEQPVYGFRSRGLDGLPEYDSIEELAAHYVRDLRAFQPEGPYYLGGYCFGGNVAYEMARQLKCAGSEVALLALINAAPANSGYFKIPWSPVWAARFAGNLAYWAKYFMSWSWPQRREFFAWKFSVLKRRFGGVKKSGELHCCNERNEVAIDPGNFVDLSSYSADQRKVWEAHIRALVNYHPSPSPGPVHLFRSGGHPLWCSFEPDYGWGEYAEGGVNVIVVPGAHEKVLEESCVAALADRFRDVLAQPGSREISAVAVPTAAAIGGVALAGFGCFGAECLEFLWHGVSVLGSVLTGKRLARKSAENRPPDSSLPDNDMVRLREWNETGRAFEVSRSYISQFHAQVSKTPDAPALRFRTTTLTYAEADKRASQLARRLQRTGVGPGVLVGFCLERSIDLVVTILAIWKCGAAYLPLDHKYPKERLRYMLEDSGAKVLVLHSELAGEFATAKLESIILDSPEERSTISALPDTQLPDEFGSDSVAYVIYTSGSTGHPKGVEILHRSLLNHNFGIADIYKLTSTDRVVQFSPISFDISVEEIFPTLLRGGLLVIRTEDVISSVLEFLKFVDQEKATVLNLPTAYWHEIVEHLREVDFPGSVRLVAIGGEKASDEALRQWKQRVSGDSVVLVNTYGPTEATVSTTFYIAGQGVDSFAIGKPLPNVQLAVLGPDFSRVPIGETGELYIGGSSLARGYLGRPELTAERFVPNPFADIKSDRLYRTGDLVRFRSDGNLDFIGRADQQVKIRGFRIELGEIESTLQEHPGIKDAAVLAREDKPGQKKLVAYVIPRGTEPPHLTEMLRFLRDRLPAYMVPANFVTMQAFPMTPAGKIDRRALPAPGATRPDLDQEYVPPRTPVEAALARIFAEVLGIDRVGALDNFFDLGGHSLIATQVLARLNETLNISLSLGSIFGFPCVAALADEIERVSGGRLTIPVAQVPGTRTVELTPQQQRIWFLDQFEPSRSPYNIPVGVRLTGRLDVGALQRSLTRMASRHEALRSTFPEEAGKPVCHILPPGPVALKEIDLTSIPEPERGAHAIAAANGEATKSHLTFKPVFCSTLLRLGPANHLLLLVFHEISVDRDSTQFLLDELAAIYEAEATGTEVTLPDPVKTRDFATEKEDAAEFESFWKEKLRDMPPLLELPSDRPRGVFHGEDGAHIRLSLPNDIARRLTDENAETTLMAAFQVLLARYTGTNDIVIGTPYSTRKTEGELGPFEDYLVIRQSVEGHLPFTKTARNAQAGLTEARAHNIRFNRLVELINPPRSSSQTPLFQVLFRFETKPHLRRCPAGVSFEAFDADNNTSKYDLTLSVQKHGRNISFSFRYSTALFDERRITAMGRHFKVLLRAALDKPETPVSRLQLMDEEEADLLDSWNQTDRPFAWHKTLNDLIEEQARRSPGDTALICGNHRMTYRQLAENSARVAARLRALGVGTGGKVALCMGRSWEMVATMLGTLRTGAAYLPVDPLYPAERIGFMLEDAQVSIVITERKLAALVSGGANEWPLLCLEDLDWNAPVPEVPQASAKPEDPAYIIYTSGSTGKPKGVVIENRNAVAFMHWAKDAFDADEFSGMLASTSICFDLSVFEILAPLCWGGRVILSENALALPSLHAKQEVRVVNTVPSAMRELLRIKGIPGSVRTINLAGEPLPQSLVEEIYSETRVQRVLDLYGPTETTTYSTSTIRVPGGFDTIGKPLQNEQVVLLDHCGELVPVGIPGEIHIGGAGVARGYLNRPELTAERFIENPLRPGERLYRTGDLGRWRPDGNLEYLGRLDNQIKVRGFRIEPGEIEAQMRSLNGIAEALVVAHQTREGEKTLVAYFTSKGEKQDPATVRSHLEEVFPAHMVPQVLLPLNRFPLTSNGKIDRKALPAPELDRDETAEFTAPRTKLESDLASIWQSILPVKEVSVRDNFFQVGGHSLLAIQIIASARELLRIELPIFAIFEHPTIEALANQISTGRWNTSDSGKASLEPIRRDEPPKASFVQERLWFLDQLNPGSDAYNVPAALRLKGPLDVARLETALNRVIHRHEALRTTFKLAEPGLLQVIAPELLLKLPLIDVPPDASLDELLAKSASQPFDLSSGPLIRAELFRTGPEEHVLLANMHHAISDGWSLAVLFRELESFYVGTEDLPQLPVQYADYADWQRQALAGDALENELNYWKSTLAGAPPAIRFPGEHNRPGDSHKAERLSLEFSEDFVQSMSRLSQENGTTPFTLLMAALAATLWRWTGQQDLVIGTVVAGRGRREIENLIGCFMNFLPVRLKVAPDRGVEAFLRSVRDTVLEAQAHQDCPFEKIVGAINPARKGDSNPLYNVALLWQNFPHDLFHAEGLQSENVVVANSAALLDLRFEAEQEGPKLSLACEFRSGKFTREEISTMLEGLRGVLTSFTAAPQKTVAEIAETLQMPEEAPPASTLKRKIVVSGTFTTEPLGDPLKYWIDELGMECEVEFAAYNQVFQELLNPGSDFGTNRDGFNVTLLRLEDWIKTRPGESVAGTGKAEVARTVAELVSSLKSFAEQNPSPHLVCICPPSRAMSLDADWAGFLQEQENLLVREIEAVHGAHVLQAKEVMSWYPVDEYYDKASEELGHVPYTSLFYTALGTAIARKIHAIRRAPCKVIVLDCDNTLWSGVCGEDGAGGIRLDTAWKALQEFMRAQQESGRLLAICSKNNPEDVEEVFATRSDFPLKREHFASAQLNWKPKSENLRTIAQELNVGLDSFVFIDDNPVECAEVEAHCPEVLTLQLPERAEEIPQFLAHTWVFDHVKLTAEDRMRAESYRQNRERERLRKESGGLSEFIAGLDLKIKIEGATDATLARVSQLTHRTNQFNLTTKRRTEPEIRALKDYSVLTVHVSDRFGDYGLVGVLIYREASESLEVDTFLLSCRVLGRGVEHAMLSRLGQIARERRLKRVELHYEQTAKNKPALNFLNSIAGSFKEQAGKGLLFRLPAGFAEEVAFNPAAAASQPVQAQKPGNDILTPSTTPRFAECRKIAVEYNDVTAIHRNIESRLTQGKKTEIRGPAPRTEMEQALAGIWSKLLRRQDIGVTDSFFDLGGHSLMAVRMFAEIERMTGRKYPLVTLFQAPTIKDLAGMLQGAPKDIPDSATLLVPVQPLGDLAPLFLVHGAGGDVLWGYANLAVHLPTDRPVYGIKSRGQVGLEECKSIHEMAACYVEAIRTRQPHGPYYLGGYCFGGNVAYEMARILKEQGETVDLVALLDSSPANAGYEDVPWWKPSFAGRFVRNTGYWLQDFSQQSFSEQMRFVRRKARVFFRKFVDKVLRRNNPNAFDLEQIIELGHFPDNELKLWQAHIQAMVEHVEQVYDGNVVLFRTLGQPLICSLEEDFCWGKLARKGVEIVRVPGSHESIFMEPNVKTLAEELAKRLPSADSNVKERAEKEALAA
jgi:amino acid adenylation domain-containing protein/FkbH-like protein